MTDKKFELGRIVVTDGAVKEIYPVDLLKGILRHVKGDWGDLNDDPRLVQARSEALLTGGSVSSVFTDRNGEKFWVLTGASRAETRVMLPGEYLDLF